MSFDDQGNKIEGGVDGNTSTQNFQNDQDTQKIGSTQTASPSQQQIEEIGRQKTIYDATHGTDRATYRDKNMRFTSSDQPGARLHFQVESAQKEMEEDLARKRFEEETTRALGHQEALDSNTRANEGLYPLRQSDGFKNFVDTQEEEAKRASAHQEALDSNAKANEGFYPLRQSDGFKNFVDTQEEATRRADAHQEALDSNTKANEGFTQGLSTEGSQALKDIDLISDDLLGKNFKKSLSELMDEETAERYLEALRKGQEEQPDITDRLKDLDTRLGEIDTKLGEMTSQLSEVNQDIQNLLEGNGLSQLPREQLLGYLTLIQEQNRLQAEISQATINRLKTNMEMTAFLLVLNNNQTNINFPPVPPTPIQRPTEVGENQLPQLEDKMKDLSSEITPEQRSAALGRQLLELETKLANGGLTDAEKIQYFDLMNQKREIDRQINAVQEESERKRKK